MVNWQTEQLRLTVFHMGINEDDIKSWWESVLSTNIENIQSQPNKGLHLVEGDHDLGRFRLEVNPEKIHIRLIAKPDDQIISGKFSTIGNYSDLWEPFSTIVKQWFDVDNFPAVNRIAFGSVLLSEVKAIEEGYQVLDKLLHDVNIDTENSTDLFYQINRPRPCESYEDLEINRLSKWSIRQLYGAYLRISKDSIDSMNQESSINIRLELDINTHKEHISKFEIENLGPIYDELVASALEISEEGDVP